MTLKKIDNQHRTTVHDLYFLCGAEIYVPSPRDVRGDTPFGATLRHIT